MSREELHISDEELLQAADGELGTRRAAQVQAHLAACWSCRTRMADIEGAITSFVRAHRQSNEPQLPSTDGPRSLLRAQLAELAHQPMVHSRLQFPWINAAHMAAVCLAVATTGLVGGIILLHQASHGLSASAAPFERGALPKRDLTPGATRSVSISEVCSIPHEEVVREVSDSIRKEVFEEYGIRNVRAEDYEIDYLIAPGLGGTENIHNLWPQPSKTAGWNALVKDDLEERLHQLVCSGDLDLSTAQRDIATDWIAAYKKYFHTDAPLPPHSRFGASVPSDLTKQNWGGNIQTYGPDQATYKVETGHSGAIPTATFWVTRPEPNSRCALS
jgi:hypothetical protein